ncbi:hypothetical protein PAMP_012443 [Pampus punctatissimus]
MNVCNGRALASREQPRRCLIERIRSVSLSSALVRCFHSDLLPPFKVNGHFPPHRKARLSPAVELHHDDFHKD